MPDFKAPKAQEIIVDPEGPVAVMGTSDYGSLYPGENPPVLVAGLARTGVPAAAAGTDRVVRQWYDLFGAAVAKLFAQSVVAANGQPASYGTILGPDGNPYPLGALNLITDENDLIIRARGSFYGTFVEGATEDGAIANENSVMIGGQSSPNGGVYGTGAKGPFWMDDRGALHIVSASEWLNASVAAYAASLVIKNQPGTLCRVNGFSTLATPQWIQLYDAAALPANGAVPVENLYVLPNQNFYFDFGADGRAFANGIVVGNSSTGPTKTIGAADCWFSAQYR